MSSQTSSSSSESSVAFPNYKTTKHLTIQNFELNPKQYMHTEANLICSSSLIFIVSSEESTNIHYLRHDNCGRTINTPSNCHVMKGLLKGKALQWGLSQANRTKVDDDAKGVKGKSGSRVPKWPKEHNVVFGELLLEQFHAGHFSKGILRRERWQQVVGALNRRLGTTYNKTVVMTRFKNMKADFRILYKLSNRSGWGWDDNLHLPIAAEEKWEEIYKECPKMRRFRKAPFLQYEIFEKICGDNVANGLLVLSHHMSESAHSNSNSETMDRSAHGVSYADVDLEKFLPVVYESGPSQCSGSKRVNCDKISSRWRTKSKPNTEILIELLKRNVENITTMNANMRKQCPYTMNDCITKLKSIPDISINGILAVQDAIMDRPENKAIFMRWDGDVLRGWIEHIVATHPHFHAASAWR